MVAIWRMTKWTCFINYEDETLEYNDIQELHFLELYPIEIEEIKNSTFQEVQNILEYILDNPQNYKKTA